MGFRALDYNISIIGTKKNDVKYGMCCAWVMQVDYDKLVCLIGAQSVTGSILDIGDKVGVSMLNKNQKSLLEIFGEHHSNDLDKYSCVDFILDGNAICINGASREMYCEVIDILHLKEIEEDSLVYLRILSSKENDNNFLHYGDL